MIGPLARSRDRAKTRKIQEEAILECIKRIKDERNKKSDDWQRGYNSAITQLEFFLIEVIDKKWE